MGVITMIWKSLGACAAVALLGGCAFNQSLQRVAVDHNRMVADSTDELMLLNIVRSRYRMPMHFSRVTSMSGDVNLELSGTAGLDLEQGGSENGALEAGATVGTNPSFEAVPMDDEKFQRGILKPIDSEVIAYLLESGYPDDLIMALFVDRIDLFATEDATQAPAFGRFDANTGFADSAPAPAPAFKKNDLVGRIMNDPDLSRGFGAFLCTHFMTASEKDTRPEEILSWPKALGGWPGLFNANELKSYPYTVREEKVDGQDYYVVRTGEGTQSGLALQRLRNSDDRCPASTMAGNPAMAVQFVEDAKGVRTLQGRAFPAVSPAEVGEANQLKVLLAGRPVTLRMELRLRSVVDVLYFLGEYLRESEPYEFGRTSTRNGSGLCASAPLKKGQYRLFDVTENAPRAQSLVSVVYRKERFGISDRALCPTQTGDRSATVLSLVQTMLNLYKANEDLPGSGRVRLIGK